ncbi:DEAD/DEAH box helicase [Ectobacillus ponti]|uniref:DEAD/DEAH box helicase n=1 Tax=Ectobacillus ponti TaxID=2961894 RepID=A0AA41XAD0_9BACI|nr:DEAD/DEAH box helicase [Ectobacillus ponti]MCP8969270.1 DEAD/DEAH box helicase [Ectobacillus ponti]
MDIQLNQKMIQDMCGTVSFKRGAAFYRANQVRFEHYSSAYCEAAVTGKEDVRVTIEKKEGDCFSAACTCPALASFHKDCQHIAAVLLAVYEHQRQGTNPLALGRSGQDLTEGVWTLFTNKPVQSSRRQLHFETRQVLDAVFICKPVTVSKGCRMFGIEMQIGPSCVQNVRDFLEQVQEGNSSLLSLSFTYNPALHCFQKEVDDVIQQLIQVVQDEKVYIEALPDQSDYTISKHVLLIPPSSWERLIPFLVRAPLVKLAYNGETFDGLSLSDEQLPLRFVLTEAEGGGSQLQVHGFRHITILHAYSSILYEGKLIRLTEEDCQRLSGFKQLLESSGTNQMYISKEQTGFFLNEVVPGLKRLGDVQLSNVLSAQLAHTPLVAKLYLDRVKDRLLAGLDFHYEHMAVNPLASRELQAVPVLMRDMEKEDVILRLMEDSLFAKTDGGYFLHNEELEYEFLYHTVPELQKLVQIYATTAVRNRIFRETARPQIRVKVNTERTNWLEFTFEMDGIPEKHIREVLLALEEKRKYYRLPNGSLLSLEAREFEEINRFLKGMPDQKRDLENGLHVPLVQGLRLLNAAPEHNVFTLEGSFRQLLENIYHPERLEFEVPEELRPILRDYQKSGYKWMKALAGYGFGGILADDMGLGKTVQSIAFILSELSHVRSRKQPILIVCPSSLTYNWLSEITKFAPDVQAAVMDGSQTERYRLQKAAADLDVVITSYPLLRRDISWFQKQSFHTVFFDEAQAFKNPITQTARAVKKIMAGHRFALTGTPVENSLEELWSIFYVVFPELFQGLKEYSNLSKETIARRIRPFLLRRLKEDVLAELPDKTGSIESVELLPEQKKLYAAYLAKLREDTLKHLDKDTLRKNRIKILAGLTRLRQICCHPALFVDGYTGGSAKFEQLLRIVEEAKLSGRRVLIFSQFTKMLALIGRELAMQRLPFFYLDGQTPSEERVEICNRFNAGERDLFLISLKAGGTGLNLTGADTVILYDTWWNPAVEEQAVDRAHRMGQTDAVQVIKLVARGTIEEKMNELQERKRGLIEEVLDFGEKVPSALTEEDIRDILML